MEQAAAIASNAESKNNFGHLKKWRQSPTSTTTVENDKH